MFVWAGVLYFSYSSINFIFIFFGGVRIGILFSVKYNFFTGYCGWILISFLLSCIKNKMYSVISLLFFIYLFYLCSLALCFLLISFFLNM